MSAQLPADTGSFNVMDPSPATQPAHHAAQKCKPFQPADTGSFNAMDPSPAPQPAHHAARKRKPVKQGGNTALRTQRQATLHGGNEAKEEARQAKVTKDAVRMAEKLAKAKAEEKPCQSCLYQLVVSHVHIERRPHVVQSFDTQCNYKAVNHVICSIVFAPPKHAITEANIS
jgi:hypothetical protein